MLSVSIIIIGDEILSSKFQDENTPFLLKELSELGVSVRTVRIISDQIGDIVSAVKEESHRSDYVFTTGGVGSTHDDLTMKAIAAAFDEQLVRNPTIEELIREKMSDNLTEAALRMADVPESTVLWDSAAGFFPQVVVHNVVIFPGVPFILQKKFHAIKERFRQKSFIVERIYLNVRESEIADQLAAIQAEHPSVQIGSYPRFNEGEVKLIFTLQAKEQTIIDACAQQIRAEFETYLLSPPSDSVNASIKES